MVCCPVWPSRNLYSKQSGAVEAMLAVVLLLSFVSTTLQTELEDCVREHGMEEFRKCCQQGEIVIKTEAGQYRLDHILNLRITYIWGFPNKKKNVRDSY